MKVVKRDGRVVEFDASKIDNAILSCLSSGDECPGTIMECAKRVTDTALPALTKDKEELSIEEIQAAVIEALITAGFPKSAVLYTEYKTRHDITRGRSIPAEVRKAFDSNKMWFPTDLQQFQFLDKYARWDPALGRREVWQESIERVMGQLDSLVLAQSAKLPSDGGLLLDLEWDLIREDVQAGMLSMEAMCSMRMLAMAGPAIERNNASAYNCAYVGVDNPYAFVELLVLLMCGCGVGFSVERQFVDRLPAVHAYREGEQVYGTYEDFWIWGEENLHPVAYGGPREKIPHIWRSELLEQVGPQDPTGRLVHVVADSSEGWADALAIGLAEWWNGLDRLDFDFSRIRPAGAKLRTKGGSASGPEPLKRLLSKAREIILGAKGRRLTTVEVYDLVCIIADCVVCGGVRRSALLCMFDWDDKNMRMSKSGNWWETHPWRQNANNSMVPPSDRPLNQAEIASFLVDMYDSMSGEPGLVSRRAAILTMPERRKAITPPDVLARMGFNPCVTADTWVQTADGPRQVCELLEKPFEAIVDGKPYECKTGFFHTGVKDVLELTLSSGQKVKATPDHKFLVVSNRTQKKLTQEWRELRDIKPGDEVMLHNHRGLSWGGADYLSNSFDEGWLVGSLLGDGTHAGSYAFLDYWGETRNHMKEHALALLHRTVKCRSDMTGHESCPTENGVEKVRISSTGLHALAEKYLDFANGKVLRSHVEETGSEYYRGFLRGWFDADGSVQGDQAKGVSVRLSSVQLPALYKAQRMLARLGIQSTVYEERRTKDKRLLPDGKGGRKLYLCEALHELVIANDNLHEFQEVVGFEDPEKADQLQRKLASYKRQPNRERFFSAVRSIETHSTQDVYDCTVEEVHRFDANGIVAHNCVEIFLRSMGFCNLTIAVARPGDTLEDLLRKVRRATILGTIQACATNFKGLRPAWTENAELERLLGVDITGQCDRPLTEKEMQVLREEVRRTNVRWANLLGINPATACTCNKPSGNSSILFDCSPGINPRWSPYQIRNVELLGHTPMFKVLKAAGVPLMTKNGESPDEATNWKASFPMQAPEGTKTVQDTSALEQLEVWKRNKVHWTDHNPSTSIGFRADELIDMAKWLYENQDIASGIAFFPAWEGTTVFKNAPNVVLTKEDYDSFVAEFPDVDFAQIYVHEQDDETTSAQEVACAGGMCLI